MLPALLVLVLDRCSDLTGPAGLKDVLVTYMGPPARLTRADTAKFTVGDSLSPGVAVTVAGAPATRAHYVFRAWSATHPPEVLHVYGSGDSIAVVGRGQDTLYVDLVGPTIGNNRIDPNAKTSDTVFVIAAPDTNIVLRTGSGPLTAVNDIDTLKAVSLSKKHRDGSRTPVSGGDVKWISTNPAIATVTDTIGAAAGDSTIMVVTARGVGTDTILTVFDHVLTVITPIVVQQTLDHYQLSIGGASSTSLASIGDSVRVIAQPVDRNNIVMTSGNPAKPAFSHSLAGTGQTTVRANTGWVVAQDNTPVPDTIFVTNQTPDTSNKVIVAVSQLATSIKITGLRTDTLRSLGDTVSRSAVAKDANGHDVPSSKITWGSSNTAIVNVSATTPTSVASVDTGRVFITASSNVARDSVVIVVTNKPASVELLPSTLILPDVNDTIPFNSVTVRNSRGDALIDSSITNHITWKSRDSTIAKALSDGRIIARKVGVTSVIVGAPNGVADTSKVIVTNYPDTIKIPSSHTFASVGDTLVLNSSNSTFKNARGVTLKAVSATWSTTDATVAKVVAGSDSVLRVFAVGGGSATISARSPGDSLVRDAMSVDVTNAPTTLVASGPDSTFTALGQTIDFDASALNANGDAISGAKIRWSVVVNSSRVSIDSITGVATAKTSGSNGSATIRATSSGVTQDIVLTVAQAYSTSRSTVTPSASSITANGTSTSTITVQLKDANGNNLTFGGSSVAITSSLGTVGSVTDAGSGRYTATLTSGTTAGTANVQASVSGSAISNSGSVTFTAGAASKYVVTPSNSTPTAGNPITVSAQLADANGNAVSTSGVVVTWTSTGGGNFSAGTSNTNSAGVATITFTTNATATSHTVTATSPGPITGTSSTILGVSGSGTHYAVTAKTTSPVAGAADSIYAQLEDANNNAVAVAGVAVNWTNTGAGVLSQASTNTDAAGIARVSLTTAAASGSADNVTATSSGGATGSTGAFSTVAGPAALNKSLVAATSPVTAGNPSTITVTLKDANNNLLTSSGGTVTVTSTLGSVGAVTDNTNGTYSATLTTSTSGSATVSAKLNGQSITSTATVTINVGGIDAAHTTASVPSGTAGSATTITIQAKDANGNNLTVGGSAGTFAVSVSGANTATPTVSYSGSNGIYTASYTPTSTGTDAITITQSGTAISGSPYSSVVGFGALNHFKVEASAGGSVLTQTAGSPFAIRITAQDASNNTVSSFTNTVTIASTGNAATFSAGGGATAAFTNGVLSSHSVTITNTGTFTLTATNGSTGTSNSFAVVAGTASAANTIATVPAGTVGSVTSITVTAKDANNNLRTSTSGVVAGSVTSGPNTGATLATTDNGDGTYTLTYTPLVANGSPDGIAITLGGTGISGSPFSSAVAVGGLDHFTIANIASQTAGQSFAITITAKDVGGNTVTSFNGNVTLSASPGTLSGGTPTVGPFVSGVLSPTVTVTSSGSTTITATNGVKTGTSNSFSVTANSASTQSTATVPGGTAGNRTTITIRAKDSNGNAISTGGATFVVDVTGSNTASGSVTDNGDGTYTATYTPSVSGSDQIDITIGGNPITGSPFTSTISPGALHHFSVTSTLGGAIANQPAGTPFNVMVTAQDANNNTVSSFTGTVNFTSTGTISAGSVSASFVAGQLASHSITITSTGSTSITATRSSGGGQTGTSNTFSMTPGAADPTQSTAIVPAGNAGSLTTITIQAKDANGNLRTTTSGAAVVSVTGANTASASVTDNLNGTYTATYTPTATGTDDIAITLGGTAISGSPYHSVVSPSTLDHFAISAVGTQIAGTAFPITITAQDVNDNTVSSFTGTVQLTSSGALSGTTVTTGSFVAGVRTEPGLVITNTGSFTITATGSSKTGTSASFTVNPGAAAPAQSTASVPATGTAGTQTSITLQVRDANGNARSNATGVTAVAGSVTSGPNAGATLGVVNNGNGTYTLTYTPTVSGGTDVIAITMDIGGGAIAISGSPFSSVISAGALNDFKVEAAAGGNISQQTAGQAFNIKITARDANLNTVTSFTGATAKVSISSNGTLSAGSGTTAAFTNGVLVSHSVTFSAAGTNRTLTATRAGGTEDGTSNTFDVVASGTTSAAQSTASVPAGVSGDSTIIIVTSRDALGNLRVTGGDSYFVSITGANTRSTTALSVSVTDNNDGTYRVGYVPTVAGTDAITIKLGGSGGTAISGSPYSSVVGPGALDHFMVESQGGGAIGTKTAGTSFNIRLTAQDAFNNTVTSYTGTADVAKGPSSLDNPTFTAGNTTTAAFVSGVLASHTVTITNTGSFTLKATKTSSTETGESNAFTVAAAAANAAQTTAIVPPTGTAGTVTTISIQAKDAFGNNRTSTSGTVTVSVTGANTATASVVDHLDGTYTATYTPTAAGADNVTIRLAGTQIGGSPFTSTVSEAAIDHFAIGAIGSQVAGTPFTVSVTAKDASNNTVTGFSGTVDLTSTGTLSGGTITTAAFTNGVLVGGQSVTITSASGPYTISVTDGSHTGTSNSFSVSPNAAAPAQSTASVPATGTAGSITSITLQVRDQFGNARTNATGVTAVAGSVTGGPNTGTTLNVTNNNNGTYALSYTPTVAPGTDQITITMDVGGGAIGISGSPFNSVISAGALDHFDVEAAGGGAIGQQTAGVSFTIKLTARDANNNVVATFTGTTAKATISSNGTLSTGSGTTAAFTNGVLASHAVTFSAAGTSRTITATRAGGTEDGTSNTFDVVASATTSAAQSTASVPAGIAGQVTTISVTSRDAFGNVNTAGTDSYTITVSGANSASTSTTYSGSNGVYTATYTPTVAGTDAITIQLSGTTSIGGSPYSSVVGPGALDHFDVEKQGGGVITTQAAGVSFNVRVVARDAFDNLVTAFSGGSNKVTFTSTSTIAAGAGPSAAFNGGILASSAITLSDAGTQNITATGGGKTGTSNDFDVLDVPVATAATLTDSIKFTANWNAFTDATSYRFDASTANNFSSFVVNNASVSSTSRVVSGLSGSQIYYYRVRAVVSGVTTSSSNVITVITLPKAPTITAITPTSQQLSVAFTAGANGNAPLSPYEYSTDAGATWKARTDGGTTASPIVITEESGSATALVNGQAYDVQIRAVNATGASFGSNQVSATPATVPDAPTGLNAASNNNDGEVHLTWTAPAFDGGSAITDYFVEWSTNNFTSVTGSTLTGSTTPAYTVTGLTNGTSYDFRVSAVNAQGTGAASTTASATPVTTPSAPAVTGITPADQQLSVAFTAPASNGGSAITGYEYTTDDGATWKARTDAGTTASPIVITEASGSATTLANGTSYDVRVRAVNAQGFGTPSNLVTATPATTPDAPTITGITPANQQLSVAFTAGGNGGAAITTYEYSTDNGVSWKTRTTGTTASPIVITETSGVGNVALTNGTSYDVMIRAVNAQGFGAGSNMVSASPATVPDAPTGLNAAANNNDGEVHLTWTAPAYDGDSPITDYFVEWSTNNFSTVAGSTLTGSTTAAYTVTGLTNGTNYDFRVSAVNAIGTGSPSGTASATPVTVPGAPTGLNASGNGNTGEVDLSWTAPVSNGGSAITDYFVEWSTNGFSTVAGSTLTGSTTAAYTVTGLTDGQAYDFRVSAVNAIGTGSPSGTASATPATVPGAPTSLNASGNGNTGEVDLSWTAPASDGGSAITDYFVEWSTDGFSTVAGSTLTGSTTAAYTVTGLTDGQAYDFRVSAKNAVGTGSPSGTASATPATVPGAPTLNSASNTGNAGELSLDFSAPGSNGGSAITDYEYSTDGGTTWASLGTASAATPVVITTESDGSTPLASATPYTVTVRARNVVGPGAASNSQVGTPD